MSKSPTEKIIVGYYRPTASNTYSQLMSGFESCGGKLQIWHICENEPFASYFLNFTLQDKNSGDSVGNGTIFGFDEEWPELEVTIEDIHKHKGYGKDYFESAARTWISYPQTEWHQITVPRYSLTEEEWKEAKKQSQKGGVHTVHPRVMAYVADNSPEKKYSKRALEKAGFVKVYTKKQNTFWLYTMQ